jgi:hypothetical protein
LHERISRLRHLIRTNYWFDEGDADTDDVYHEVLYEKGLRAAAHCAGRHWMASFSPNGYAYRFDALANVLASLLQVADTSQTDKVDEFITSRIVREELPLLPAFHPVIRPVDEDWKDLHVMFSYSFKNRPYEYHNGGLWAMITGFYVADLARRQHTDRARVHLQAIHRANALPMDDKPWGFPEYVHGQTLQPGGTREQGWSAAAAVIGQHAMRGQPPLRIGTGES